MKKKSKTLSFFWSTLIVIGSGFVIKILGLLNKIIITRVLGTAGMSLYIMSFPTIMLFINLSSMTMSLAVSKMIAESQKTKNYSPKEIIRAGLKITAIASIIMIAILLLIVKYLSNVLLHNSDLLYPLLTTVLLIPLVGISDTLRGYFSGLKKMGATSTAQLVEQVTRIAFSIIFLYLFIPYGIVLATTLCLVSLSIGELCSIIYLLVKIKKTPPEHIPNTSGEKKGLLQIAVPTTFTRLLGSFTYFLEPIIYTFFLGLVIKDNALIQTEYTIINAYTIPLLTTASFLSYGIATTLIPHLAEKYVSNEKKAITYLTRKTILYSLIPGALVAFLLFFYPDEFMYLIYRTHEGTRYIKGFVFVYLLYYLQAPMVAILQATNHSKAVLITSTSLNFLRLILIALLSLVPSITTDSIFYAVTITVVLGTIILAIKVQKVVPFRFEKGTILSLIILFGLTFFLGTLFQKVGVPYLVASILLSFVYLWGCWILKLLDIRSLQKSKTSVVP